MFETHCVVLGSWSNSRLRLPPIVDERIVIYRINGLLNVVLGEIGRRWVKQAEILFDTIHPRNSLISSQQLTATIQGLYSTSKSTAHGTRPSLICKPRKCEIRAISRSSNQFVTSGFYLVQVSTMEKPTKDVPFSQNPSEEWRNLRNLPEKDNLADLFSLLNISKY